VIRKEEGSSATGSVTAVTDVRQKAEGRRQNKNAILLLIAIPIYNFSRLF
jgi:hypothetical protein